MTHRSKLFFGLGLILVALVAFGCGDDEPAAPTNTNNTGNLEDPEFAVVQEQIENYITDATELFAVGLENIYNLPTDTEEVRNQYSASGPNDTVTAHYENGWHVTYIARHNSFFDDYYSDSVQFRVNNDPVESSDGLDYMRYIREWQYTDNRTEYTHTNSFGKFDLQFSDLDQSVATIAGSNNVVYEWNFISADSNVTAFFDIQGVVGDVEIAEVPTYGWTSGCPISGTLAIDIDEAYTLYDGLATDMNLYTWEVDVTFSDGMAAVKVVKNNTEWNYSYEVCNPPNQ